MIRPLRRQLRVRYAGQFERLALLHILAFSFCLDPAVAQEKCDNEPKGFTLAEFLVLAVKQNPSLTQASIDVEVAATTVEQVASQESWLLDVSALVSAQQNEEFGLDQQNILGLDASVRRALPTGGTLAMRAESKLTDTTIADIRDQSVSSTFTATYEQPLLRGRGRTAARAALSRVRSERSLAGLTREVTVIGAVRDIVRLYWELAYAWKELEIRKASLAMATEHLRRTRVLISGGKLAPTEATAVEQTIVLWTRELLVAKRVIAEHSIELRRLVGMKIGQGAVELHTATTPRVVLRQFHIEQLIRQAYTRNPEIAFIENQRKHALFEVELARNQSLPRLDVSVTLGPTGVASTSGVRDLGINDVGNSLKRAVTFDDFIVMGSITYQQPIGVARSTGRRIARASLRRAKNALDEKRSLVAAGIVRTVQDARLALEQIHVGQRAVELARKNVAAEIVRFELGRVTNFDVMKRQDELRQAELANVRAIVDYLNAVVMLDALTGELLSRHSITI